MSIFSDVNLYDTHTDVQVASGVTAFLTDDAEIAQLWGGTWNARPTVGSLYRMISGGVLDWTGVLTDGQGSKAEPYRFTVSDSERERRRAKRDGAAT
ncbi:MAG TPA: hypothetical protein VFP84_32260 [Kofleriaceae bacterium]|nr:hypothetical protein [Kofleriaceae bacterium]